jgi:hypothetical protein
MSKKAPKNNRLVTEFFKKPNADTKTEKRRPMEDVSNSPSKVKKSKTLYVDVEPPVFLIDSDSSQIKKGLTK